MTYLISLTHATPRPIAVVSERIAARDVPARFRPLLDQVYAAAKAGVVALDGQNVFVYHTASPGVVDVEFGVGALNAFAPVGRVVPSATPEGDVATTTHWGDYSSLGQAHSAVTSWCREAGHTLAGVSWEVYGHWSDDPRKVRTDIYHLLARAAKE